MINMPPPITWSVDRLPQRLLSFAAVTVLTPQKRQCSGVPRHPSDFVLVLCRCGLMGRATVVRAKKPLLDLRRNVF